MSALAKRYARAAGAAVGKAVASEGSKSNLDELTRSLQGFVALYDSHPELRESLHNPVFKQQRSAVLDAILAQLSVRGVGAKLIKMMAKHDRMLLLTDVVSALEELADAHAGRLRARVCSAIEVSPAQQERISQALQKRLGQRVAVSVSIDPTLLGGLVCQVGDLTFDSSLKRQLEIMTERLGAHAT